MEFSENNELFKKSYVLSNEKCFFHRFYDTGFKNKWTGLWAYRKKFLEFFAFKVNGFWLSESNCTKTIYNYWKAVHFHETLESIQYVYIPKRTASLVFGVETNKNSEIEALLAFDIRWKEENYHERNYKVTISEKGFKVGSDLGFVFVKIDQNSEFEKNEQYAIHYPSGEKQRYFVPGKIKSFGNKLEIHLIVNDFESETKTQKERFEKAEKRFESDYERLSKIYKMALSNIELLKEEKLFYAGLPWFLEFWARDLLIASEALLYLGEFERVKNILEFFLKYEKNGVIPNYVYKDSVMYNSIDSGLLEIVRIADYVEFSGDINFVREHASEIKRIVEYYASLQENGLIKHDIKQNETWMDTVNRGLYAIEIQALFYKALNSFLSIAKFSEKLKNIEKIAKNALDSLLENFPEKFLENGKIADRLFDSETPDFSLRPNFLFANTFFKLKDNFSEIKKDGLFSEAGIRTLSALNENFSGNAYHNGSAWSLTTAWYLKNAIIYNQVEEFLKVLEIYERLFLKINPGLIPECLDSITSENLGCIIQLWGATEFVSAIDKYLLGIKVNALKKELGFEPKPFNWSYIKKVIRIGNEFYEVEFEKRKHIETRIRKIH